MTTDNVSGDFPVKVLPKIVVFGVGGAGINSVNNMILSGLDNVKFIVANTDCQSLSNSLADSKIQLGAKCTKGLGAGAKPEIGRQSAEEAIDSIKREISDADMLFIATGMGGGTGTGASPVIAKIAKDLGILTVAIVTKPFLLEGKTRMETANKGIEEMEKLVDTIIIIENQKLVSLANVSMAEGFSIADGMLRKAVNCVVDILTKQGFINRDFADIKTVLSSMGRSVIGYGEDVDPKIATDCAMHNQILENNSIQGAKNILLNITGSKNIKPSDVEDVINTISNEADTDNIIFGIAFDDNLCDRIGVSIIAAGVDCNSNQNVKENQISNKNDNLETVNNKELQQDKENIILKDIDSNDTQEVEENNKYALENPVFVKRIDEEDIDEEFDSYMETEEILYNELENFTQFGEKKKNDIKQEEKKKIDNNLGFFNQLDLTNNNSVSNTNKRIKKDNKIKLQQNNNYIEQQPSQTLFDSKIQETQKKGFFGKVLNAIIPNPFTTYNDNISADDFSDDSIDDEDIYYIPAIQRKKIAN